VFDPLGRVLMIEAHDPARRGGPGWWEVPGGGVDPGEDTAAAVHRELWEEAGIRDAEVGPVVWVQSVEFTFGGWRFDQDEWIHVARCSGHTSAPGGLETLEALAFGEQRWWDVDELVDSGERTIPYRMAEHLPALRDGQVPDEPIDITPDAACVAAWRATGRR